MWVLFAFGLERSKHKYNLTLRELKIVKYNLTLRELKIAFYYLRNQRELFI